jgi:hypothetical protein
MKPTQADSYGIDGLGNLVINYPGVATAIHDQRFFDHPVVRLWLNQNGWVKKPIAKETPCV